MRNRTKRKVPLGFLRVAAIAAFLAFPCRASEPPFRSPYPAEPERYDSEYYLDILTMRFDPEWRDFWYARDNAFALRFGSLNVEQWNLEESLKFSTSLGARWRLRYWMEMRNSLDERAAERNELELEYRLGGATYLSLLIEPAFWKRENDAGICIQRRRAIDRYVRLIFRVRDFANDFAYKHGENIEGEMNLYAAQPVEFVLEGRETIGEVIHFGFCASATNTWSKDYRFLTGTEPDYRESAYARDGSLWFEYEALPSLRVNLDARAAEYYGETSGRYQRVTRHRVREFIPHVWWYANAGADHSANDDEADALERRAGVGVCAGVEIRREGAAYRTSGFETVGESDATRKTEFLPFLLFRRGFTAMHMVELGYLGDRYDFDAIGPGARSSERWENRIKLSYEMRFKERGRFRVTETIDLDPEDWGQFSIHDHFFLMLMLGF
jgi:hypothetical protein